MSKTTLSCRCCKVELETEGSPILSAECCCTSCRMANSALAGLPGATSTLTEYGATPYVLMRKDRVRILQGQELLAEYRLKPKVEVGKTVTI